MSESASQSRHPWRATARTVIQGALGLAAATPIIAGGLNANTAAPAIAVALSVSAVVTRVMALPEVNALLKLIGLDADPQSSKNDSV